MIIEDTDKKKELDKIPDADEHGDPIYKIDSETDKLPEIGEVSNSADSSEFKDTPQDLKDTTSQEYFVISSYNNSMILEFSRNDLASEPEKKNLNINKSIVVFNINTSDKIETLNTGNRFNYQDDIYEVMNREPVDQGIRYIKFNCILMDGDNSY